MNKPVPDYLGESSSGAMGDRAPMQGDITHIYVEAGAAVEKGDPLLALESMKMEYVIRAPKKGSIEKILVAKGDNVQKNAPLVVFKDDK